MADRSNVSGLGMVVTVAVVSTGVILASYHLIHRRLDSNLKLYTTVGNSGAEKRRQNRTKKKKVRFAEEVAAPADTSSEGDEYRRRLRATAAASGKLVRPALPKTAYSSMHLAC